MTRLPGWTKLAQILLAALSGSTPPAQTHSTNHHAHNILHLNHAGASPCTDAVLERVVQHLHLEQQLGGYAAAAAVQDELEAVYQAVADLLQAASPAEIALVESATVAWTRIFYAAADAHRQKEQQQQQHQQSPNDNNNKKNIILVSEAEYAANLVAACRWAETQHQDDWTVLAIPSSQRHTSTDECSSTGKVNVAILQDMLQGKFYYNETLSSSSASEESTTTTTTTTTRLDPSHIAMVLVTMIPTNSGIINPVYKIGQLIADYNNNNNKYHHTIFYLVDACQAVGQVPLSVTDMQCHALVGTGRKYLRGPRGTGFLYVQRTSSSSSSCTHYPWPHHCDHFGVPVQHVPSPPQESSSPVFKLSYAPLPSGRRFEFWESNLAARLGLGVAVRQVPDQQQAAQTIYARAQELVSRLSQLVVQLHHGPPECGIVTFWVPGVSSQQVQQRLWQEHQVEVSVVPATSTPLDSAVTGVPDLLRASVSYTTTTEELDLFVERLSDVLAR